MPGASADIIIVDTGAANLASMAAAWRRLDTTPVVTADPARVEQADRVVVPGVGAFATGMASLRESGLDRVLRKRADDDRPLFGVCLGLQLWCAASDESPGVDGLGHIPNHVAALVDAPTLPHMGWNEVTASNDEGIVQAGHAYFANSFALQDPPAGYLTTTVTHGTSFVASIQRGNFLACQFHPELSGRWGLDLMRRWYELTEPTSC